MREEILINVSPHETRVAQLESGMLQEVHIERRYRRGVMNNIYLGKVVRVMPGMEAAFVDIGLERAAFIHVNDLREADGDGFNQRIESVLKEGQKLAVQVVKEPLGTKGARLTTHLTVSSRYLVLMPKDNHLAISAKIEDVEERQRLMKALCDALGLDMPESPETDEGDSPAPTMQPENHHAHGYIVRTLAEGAQTQEFIEDAKFLEKLWRVVNQRIDEQQAPSMVYEDLPLEKRVLRDMTSRNIERIRVDKLANYERMRLFAKTYIPKAYDLLEHYDASQPIFDLYHLEDDLQRALEKKVPLKSGGYLIFDQTEAMTTVDVNTGSFIGSRNLEETTYRTNLEAAECIARQLRLRNLGGIIIIDFIDMHDEEHKRQVLRALEKALDKDTAKTRVCEVSELGLVEMTRKRTSESLKNSLCEPCSSCEGRGTVKTAESVCYEVFREIARLVRNYQAEKVRVLANQTVVDALYDIQSSAGVSLGEMEDVKIVTQIETLYTQEQFDVVIV